MPHRQKPANSKKIKKRAPIREAFKAEYVDGENVLSVQFAHRDNKDVLVATVSKNSWVDLPDEFMGYPVVTRFLL